MSALEDRLRESLHDYATLPKPDPDLARVAIAGSRTVQRRRLVLGLAAVIVAVAATAGGLGVGLRGSPSVVPADPTGSPSTTSRPPTAAPYGLGVDVVEDGHRLRTIDGRTFELTGDGHLLWLARVPVGWVFERSEGDARLLRPDGTTITLKGVLTKPAGGEQPPGPVVSADGRSIAWSLDTTLSAGRLTVDGVRDVVRTTVPAQTFAANWVGQRVVVGQTYAPGCCGSNKARYDAWDPSKGTFVPRWTADLNPVYGPVPDGVALFGMASKDASFAGCLARLDGVRDLSVIEQACVPGLVFSSLMGALSPDGRHLVELSDGGSGRLAVFELPAVLQTKTAVRQCPALESLVWEDNAHYLAINSTGQVIRCAVDTDATTMIGGLTSSVLGPAMTLVPRYGM